MKSNPLPRIESITTKTPTTLVIVWSTGDVTPVDLAATIKRLRVYQPLTDTKLFRCAKPACWGHAVVWTDDIDMGADALWDEAMYQNPQPDPTPANSIPRKPVTN